MVVLKFGGKSLEGIQKANDICLYIKMRAKAEKVIVVVSAMGNTTNNLLTLASTYGGSKPVKREVDMLISTGEIQSAALISLMLNNLGVKAISLSGPQANIYTMGDHTCSVITGINKSTILDYLNTYSVVVIAGFQGVNTSGDITTIGRGGSDTSAVALGAALGSEVEIYSNYNGVFAGDPQNLDYIKLDSISYNNMQNLSNSGAKVLSSTSVDIARQAKVSVVCKQSSNPSSVGTFVNNVPIPLTSIVVTDNLCQIKVISSNPDNIIKTTKYIIENLSYYSLDILPSSITLLVDKNLKTISEQRLASFNKLLKQNKV